MIQDSKHYKLFNQSRRIITNINKQLLKTLAIIERIMDDMFGMLFSGLKPTQKFLTAVSCNMVDTLNKLLEDKLVNIDSKLQVSELFRI